MPQFGYIEIKGKRDEVAFFIALRRKVIISVLNASNSEIYSQSLGKQATLLDEHEARFKIQLQSVMIGDMGNVNITAKLR